MSLLRPIAPGDYTSVLALNERFVDLLAPLDGPRLDLIRDLADRACVIDDGGFAGFVITVAPGTTYDSMNYRWFCEHLGPAEFVYLDRIVIDPAFRRRGLASRVYDVIEADAPSVALEVNVDPPNAESLAFHSGRGYTEVHRHLAGGHLVGLMTRVSPRP